MLVKLNKGLKLCYFDNAEATKNSKSFWNECKPYCSNQHAHGYSKIILLKKKKLLIIQMGLSKKETLLVNNDEITKTLNEHFAETAEILNTSELTFSRSLVVSGC